MSTFAALGVYSRNDDWLIAGVVLFLCYIVLFPLYLLLVRQKHTLRIKNQLVTSLYTLPVALTPAELAYMFSTKVRHPQLYATLLHLTNRSVVVMEKKNGKLRVRLGPKIEDDLRPYEVMLLAHIQPAGEGMFVDRAIQGFTNYKTPDGTPIRGSRQYVFWWLLRESLRDRKLIGKRMTGKYSRILLQFGVAWSLFLTTVPLVVVRSVQMLETGEVDFSPVMHALRSGLLLWVLLLPILIVTCFFLLRLRGRMLGREWLMTDKLKRYLQQIDAYREFVRLTHHDKLRFESKELKQEARAITRPYAIAFGYVKE